MKESTLCLDLGTKTGYAIVTPGLSVSGTWELATKTELEEQRKAGLERRCDIRFTRLYNNIFEVIKQYTIKRIVFEDVTFNTSQFQAQLWASLRAAIWLSPCEIQCVPVKTLKAFATNNGNADKLEMKHKLENIQVVDASADDNEIDAIWLAHYTKAVDAGIENWNSVWEKKLEAKKLKTAKLAAKRNKIKVQKEETFNNAFEALLTLLNTANANMPKMEMYKITKQALKEPVSILKPFGYINSKMINKKIKWTLNPLS